MLIQELVQALKRLRLEAFGLSLVDGTGATKSAFTTGSGSPEGVVAAPMGSVYLNSAGGASTTLYIKESGGSAVAATGTLTFSGNAVAGETVTIGGTTYTFVTGDAGAVPYAVKVGATAANTVAHLVNAINAGAGVGIEYGTGTTAHPTVSAVDGAGDTVVVTALTAGEAGNSISTSDSMTVGAWGASTLTGGSTYATTGWVGK